MAFNGAPIQVDVLDDGPVGQLGGAGMGCAVGTGHIGGGGFAFGTPAPAGSACVGVINDQALNLRGRVPNDPSGYIA